MALTSSSSEQQLFDKRSDDYIKGLVAHVLKKHAQATPAEQVGVLASELFPGLPHIQEEVIKKMKETGAVMSGGGVSLQGQYYSQEKILHSAIERKAFLSMLGYSAEVIGSMEQSRAQSMQKIPDTRSMLPQIEQNLRNPENTKGQTRYESTEEEESKPSKKSRLLPLSATIGAFAGVFGIYIAVTPSSDDITPKEQREQTTANICIKNPQVCNSLTPPPQRGESPRPPSQ